MRMNRPPLLLAFYQSWLDWVKVGAPNGEPYLRSQGLCSALRTYCRRNSFTYTEDQTVEIAMRAAFKAECEDPVFPFDTPKEFILRAEDNGMHLNINRILWCMKQIARGKLYDTP